MINRVAKTNFLTNIFHQMKQKTKLCSISDLEIKNPKHFIVKGLDLVVIRYGDEVSVLYGRCLHRGALMADGHVEGNNIICGLHGWDYRIDTGVSEYNNEEALHKFSTVIEDESVYIDEKEIEDFLSEHPQSFQREEYLGEYADTHPEETEPYTLYIQELSKNGLKNYVHHGPTSAMGVDRNKLPKWEDIQFLPAQLASRPLMDEDPVETRVIIGPNAKRPLVFDIPVFVSDMSFGALSREAKISLDEMIESAWHCDKLHPSGYRISRETRYSPFWGKSVNISDERSTRPWKGETQKLTDEDNKLYEPDCYLCPGNMRTGNNINPDYKGTWSFQNDFPTLKLNAYEADLQFGPYSVRPSKGICEVIVYNPNHSKRLSTMEITDIRSVVDKWVETYERLGAKNEIKYVLIFENRGSIMGCSQPHPHGQVYAFTEIPDLMIKPQIYEFNRYREKTGNCFVCEANKFENDDKRRIVAVNKSFVAYVPFAAMLPYDIAIVPLNHIAHITELNDLERSDLALILKDTLSGLDNLFNIPYHYSLALIQAPTDGIDYGYHMQIHITSLLMGRGIRKYVVGADIYGMIINPVDPDLSAAKIKHAMRK